MGQQFWEGSIFNILISKKACDCKAVVDHVSIPIANEILKISVGILNGPDPFFFQPNDKEVQVCNTNAPVHVQSAKTYNKNSKNYYFYYENTRH